MMMMTAAGQDSDAGRGGEARAAWGAAVAARRGPWGAAAAEVAARGGAWEGAGAAVLARERAVYRGEWRAGKRHGAGALEQAATGVRFEGVFEEDAPRGPGRKQWPSGAAFVGEIDDRGAPSGRGMYQNLAGDTTFGAFREGRCNGLGKTFFVNGDVYVGAFKDGKSHGLGEKTMEGAANASPVRGEWTTGAITSVRDERDAGLREVLEAADACVEDAMAFCEEVQKGVLMRVRDATLRANAICVAARDELGLDVDDQLYEICKRAPRARAAPEAATPAPASREDEAPARRPRRPAPRPPEDDGAASETMSFATATWQESLADDDAGDDRFNERRSPTRAWPAESRDEAWDAASEGQRSSTSPSQMAADDDDRAASEADDRESLPAPPRAPSDPEALAAMQNSLSRLRERGGAYLPSPFDPSRDADEHDDDDEDDDGLGPRRPGSAPAIAGNNNKLLSIRGFISSKFAGQLQRPGRDGDAWAALRAAEKHNDGVRAGPDAAKGDDDDSEAVLSARQYALLWKSLNPARGASGAAAAASSMYHLGADAAGWNLEDSEALHNHHAPTEHEHDEEPRDDDHGPAVYRSARKGRGAKLSVDGASSVDPSEFRPPMHPPPSTVSTLASERGDALSDLGTTMSYLAPPSHPPPSVAGSEMTWDSDAHGGARHNLALAKRAVTPPVARSRSHRAQNSLLRAKPPPPRPKTAPPLAPLRPPYPPRRPPLPPADPNALRPPSRPPLPPSEL